FYLLYFFFQAEDGIRDFHVTGVQTCALPISARAASRGQEEGSVAAPPHAPIVADQGRRVRRRGSEAGRPRAGRAAGSRLLRPVQIGRASCRERVWLAVGAGGLSNTAR